MADDLFNLLSSSARIKKKQKNKRPSNTSDENHFTSNLYSGFSITEKENEKDNSALFLNSNNNEQVHREEIAAFRRRMRIRVSDPQGSNCPDPICSFRDIKMKFSNNDVGDHDKSKIDSSNRKKQEKSFRAVKSVVLNNIEQGKWVEPTPVQMQAIPALLSGYDVMAAAPTGSGKSGAFIIPAILLSKCGNKNDEESIPTTSAGQVRSLLLAPSRELAAQIYRETVRLGSNMPGKLRCALLSKSNFGSLVAGKIGGEMGIDILVSTPLRLCEALMAENSKINLRCVRLVTLDEADRLLDATDGVTSRRKENKDGVPNNEEKESGSAQSRTFVEQIDSILQACGESTVRAMFSATMGGKIRNLAETVLRSPVDLAVNSHGGSVGANSDIDQQLVFVGREEGKLLEIRKLITKGIKPPVLIFLQSKERAQALYKELRYEKVNGKLFYVILNQ